MAVVYGLWSRGGKERSYQTDSGRPCEEVINRTVCKSIKHVTAFPGRLNEGQQSENPLCLEPDIQMWKIPLKPFNSNGVL